MSLLAFLVFAMEFGCMPKYFLLLTEEYDTGSNSFFVGCSETKLARACFSSNQG